MKRTARVRLYQHLHAGAILVVPLLGTLAALVIAARDGLAFVDVALFVGMYIATMLGMTVGFHRLLSHGAFAASPIVRGTLVILGSMAAQGPLVYWVTNHRRHHHLSDRAGDPHSPHHDGQRDLVGWRGFLHAHIGWTFDHELSDPFVYGKDLFRDRLLVRINRHYYALVALGIAIPAALGAVAGGAAGAITGALWGGLVRLFCTYHASCAVNSIGHLFGKRAFTTREHSRNNGVLAIATLGEGWHNNHHAFPSSARFGLGAMQPDAGAWVIETMAKLSLVSDVKVPSEATIERRTQGVEHQV